jgi:hypothetical protein
MGNFISSKRNSMRRELVALAARALGMDKINVKSYCVLDFSWYYGIDNVIIVKELAIVMPEHGQQQSWVFMAPYFWDELSWKTQRKNAVMRRKGLQFRWEEGNVPYHQLADIISSATQNYQYIVVNGFKKSEYIADIICRPVFDMSIVYVPEYPDVHEAGAKHCIYHRSENSSKCAQKRCMKFAAFVSEKVHEEQQQQYYINSNCIFTAKNVKNNFTTDAIADDDEMLEVVFSDEKTTDNDSDCNPKDVELPYTPHQGNIPLNKRRCHCCIQSYDECGWRNDNGTKHNVNKSVTFEPIRNLGDEVDYKKEGSNTSGVRKKHVTFKRSNDRLDDNEAEEEVECKKKMLDSSRKSINYDIDGLKKGSWTDKMLANMLQTVNIEDTV